MRCLAWAMPHNVAMKNAYSLYRITRFVLLALVLVPVCLLAQAQVTVDNAWARASVPGQKSTSVFMTLRSEQGARLLSVSSPVASYGEVHEMRMDGDVMQMRALTDGLALPPGRSVALTPGGFHIMLMDLKSPLKADTTVPLTLVFQDAKGVEGRTEIQVPVRSMAAMEHMH